MNESKREIDINGYILIEDNPISKVGVFPYTGMQIATKEQLESGEIDPNRTYNVYRPAEEFLDPECIESFKLVPFTDEHELLGRSEDDLTPPERKGVHGVTGENVYFDSNDGYFKSNLKIFSEKLANLIESGKKELSMGYRCTYDLTSGEYDGIRFDAIQRKLRGNHLALVQKGRAGPDVAVLDHFKFTIDSKEIEIMNEETTVKPSLEEAVVNGLGAMHEAIKAIAAKLDVLANAEKKEVENVGVTDESKKEEGESEADKEVGDACKDEEETHAMDAALKKVVTLEKEFVAMKKDGLKALMSELTQRNALAQKISKVTGTFDHAEKTAGEVARYGVEKLGLKCPEGQEITALEAYFKGAANVNESSYVADASDVSGFDINKILKGE